MAREADLLQIGLGMFLSDGFLGLSMDRLAGAVECSKGTVYQHFVSKEDFVLAMMLQADEYRHQLLTHAAVFRGKPRERVLALTRAHRWFSQQYPAVAKLERIVQWPEIPARASLVRQRAWEHRKNRPHALLTGMVRDAISQTHLPMMGPQTIDEIAQGLLALVSSPMEEVDPGLNGNLGLMGLPEASWETLLAALLDGLNWQPRSTELDGQDLHQRIEAEVLQRVGARLDVGFLARRSRAASES